jgi:hypothetical protein
LEARAIADDLNAVPLLCALVAEELRNDVKVRSNAIREIVQRYLKRQVQRVSNSTGRPNSEYLSALKVLAKTLLRQKNLRPKWGDVQDWLKHTDALDRLRELHQNRAGISCDPVSEIILFNHDRFLDALCVEVLPSLIDEADIYGDPYFAEVIGRAIAEERFDDKGVEKILEINPLAVFCGLRFANDVQKKLLAPFLIKWAEKYGNSKKLPQQLFREIALVLLYTDSSCVEEFASRFGIHERRNRFPSRIYTVMNE